MQNIRNFMGKKIKKLIKTAFNKPIISVLTPWLGFKVGLSAAQVLPCQHVHPDALPWLPVPITLHPMASTRQPRLVSLAGRRQAPGHPHPRRLLSSMSSLPPPTTSQPGMQALPESCGRAGFPSEAVIKLQSCVTPLCKHVRQEYRCGPSSAEWL